MTYRDHNGERGPVPTDYRAHDWQVCRLLRELAEEWRARRVGAMTERLRIAAVDLHVGDQVLVTVMGGEDYHEVVALDRSDLTVVRADMRWGWHMSAHGPGWQSFDPEQALTVLR